MKFIFECDVHGVKCGHDVECVPRWGADLCEMWSDVNVFRHGVIEMQNV